VTHSIEDYEALALRLTKDPSLLEGNRNRLAQNRLTHALFDTDRCRRHIEAAGRVRSLDLPRAPFSWIGSQSL